MALKAMVSAWARSFASHRAFVDDTHGFGATRMMAAGKDQIMTRELPFMTAALLGGGIAIAASAGVANSADAKRVRITVGDRTVTATLNDSAASRDFMAMLPLSLHMTDWLRREKVARLPGQLSQQSHGVPTYVAGDIGYWRPSNNFVIYYLQDGERLPSPGIVPLGKIDSGHDLFNVPGDVDVKVELAN
jgi:hypothetical protein